jgi:hypothetical protein
LDEDALVAVRCPGHKENNPLLQEVKRPKFTFPKAIIYISNANQNMTSAFTIGLMEFQGDWRSYLLGGVSPFTSQGKFLQARV